MNNRNGYLRMRNGRVDHGLPPHYVDEKNQEVVFHIKGGFPTTMAIPQWMRCFPDGYKGLVVRCEETFYKLRAKVNEG